MSMNNPCSGLEYYQSKFEVDHRIQKELSAFEPTTKS